MKNEIKRIAMLSTHGYFDPVPVLGQTDTGGQVVYVLELAKSLSENGVKVDIFTRWFDQSKKQLEPVPGHENVRVIRIPCGPWEFIPKEYIYEFLPELSRNMVSFIRENNLDYDLFHGHYVDAGIVTIDVAAQLKKPSFFTAHSLGAWKREQMGGDAGDMEEKFKFNHRINEEIRIFETVNAHTVTSQLQLEKIRELYGYLSNNVEVINPGVNVHKYHPPVPTESLIKTGLPEKYIYTLSRIDSNKGYDMLLKAFDIVRKQKPEVRLVIGGGSPDPKPREMEVFKMMRDIIRERGMEKSVDLKGYIPENMMVPYYQQALFFVLPSLFEPFGMTTQEAMACGKPVVASRYGGIRTVITNNEDGILVDPKNETEFSDVMMKLLNDHDFREKIGHAAYLLIQDHFSWEVIAGKHLDFYRKYA